jgi:hypothetical protein
MQSLFQVAAARNIKAKPQAECIPLAVLRVND